MTPFPLPTSVLVVQTAGVVEYTNWFSADDQDPFQLVSWSSSRFGLRETPTVSLQRDKPLSQPVSW